jgi:malonyl CoA-acyl carrier protein transacylase
LGEYSALVAAGALPFADAVQIVRERGRLMQAAAKPGFGGMAAVILENLPHAEVTELAESFGVDVANDNSANQVVLSGEQVKVEQASAALVARFAGMRVVPLTVSAPFHSRHMAAAEAEFRQVLAGRCGAWSPEAAVRVTSNTTGELHTGRGDDLVDALARQLSGRVRWRDNMEVLRARANSLIELGPNRPLSGFFKTIGVVVPAIVDVRSAQRVLPPVLEAIAV